MPEPIIMEPDVVTAAPAHEMLETDHASAWLGIELVHLADGHATITMVIKQEMLNGFAMVHGGMVFAFADTAFALACNPVQPDGTLTDPTTITVASGVDINFLRPAYLGQQLRATATRRSIQGRSGIYDIQVAAESGGEPEVIAEFRGRCRTVPRPGLPSSAPS